MISFVKKGKDTSDATATADDILYPKTAYVDNEKISGNIQPVYSYDPTSIISDNRITSINNSGNYPMALTYDREILVDYNGSNIRVFKYNSSTQAYVNIKNYTRSELGISQSIIKEIKISKLEVVNGFYRIGFMMTDNLSSLLGATETVILNFLKKDSAELNVMPEGYTALTTGAKRFSYGSGGFAFAENNPNYVTVIGREDYNGPNNCRLYTYLLGQDSKTLYDSNTSITPLEDIIDIEYCGNDKYIRIIQSITNANGDTYLLALNNYCFNFVAYNGKIAVNNTGDLCIKYSNNSITLSHMNNNGSSLTFTDLYVFNSGLPNIVYWGENNLIYNIESTSSLKIYVIDSLNFTLTLLGTFTSKLDVRGKKGTPTFYNYNYSSFVCKNNGNNVCIYYYSYNTAGVLVELIKNNIPFINTSDANAGINDILVNKTAYVNGSKLQGSISNNGTLSYTPSTSQQSIPAGYTSGGTIAAVTSAIDANIAQNNIKAGVTILGVTGNVEPDKPDQTKTCTPTTSQQVIQPDTGYELASVTVNGVTSAIDNNIQAGNIKKDITILGVTGTYGDELVYDETLTQPVTFISKFSGTSSTIRGMITNVDIDTSDCVWLAGYCDGLTNLKTLVVDMSSVEEVRYMCNNCESLETVVITNMPRLSKLDYMFFNCHSLRTVTGLNFNILPPTGTGSRRQYSSLDNMFMGCNHLQELDLSTLNVSNNPTTINFFTGVPTSCHIIVTDRTAFYWVQDHCGYDYQNITISSEVSHTITANNVPEGISVPTFGYNGLTYHLTTDSSLIEIISFKVNGTLYQNTTEFIMPDENVTITEITVQENLVFESSHNPYYGTDEEELIILDGEIPGADSLTITVDYGLDDGSFLYIGYDGIIGYDDETGEPITDWIFEGLNGNGTYGSDAHTTVTYNTVTPYITAIFVSNESAETDIDYYGYKIALTKVNNQS